MKSVIITGCAGFIGSHTTEIFLEAGYNVVGVDAMTYASSRKNMDTFIDDITFFESDICDTETMKEIVKDFNISWIINFAAETHVDNSIESCESFIHSNIVGVQSLLEVCRTTGCGILQISTDEVYGSIREGESQENDRLDPRNPYSATKAAAEHLVTSYNNTYGIPYKMVRMSNNFGPRQHKEKFLPTILRKLSANQKIPVYGDGSNIRDWFYVRDCASLIKIVHERGILKNVYNLTYNNEMTNIEIVKMILEMRADRFEECVEFVEDSLGHDFRYAMSNSKVKRLGSSLSTSMQDALCETIAFYEEKEE